MIETPEGSTVFPAGTVSVTTELAPITTLSPIVILPKTQALGPKKTRLPIVGTPFFFP